VIALPVVLVRTPPAAVIRASTARFSASASMLKRVIPT
jgi:hypothetical protein